MTEFKIEREGEENIIYICPECPDAERKRKDAENIMWGFKIKEIRLEICEACNNLINKQ